MKVWKSMLRTTMSFNNSVNTISAEASHNAVLLHTIRGLFDLRKHGLNFADSASHNADDE